MKSLASLLLAFSSLQIAYSFAQNKMDSHDLEHEVRGSGDLVVLFDAGALSGMAGWDAIWNDLPAGITAIRYSRRGEGNSAPCRAQMSLSEYAADLENLLTFLEVETPFIYVSHSLGSAVSKRFVMDYPHRVSSLLLLDPPNPGDVDIVKTLDPTHGAAELEQIKANDYAAGNGGWCFLDAIWDKTPLPGPSQIGDIPVTLIAGVKKFENPSQIFQRDEARSLWGTYQRAWVEQFPQGRAVITPNSGHFVQDDEPKLVLAELERLIRISLK